MASASVVETLSNTYGIGCHIGKKSTLVATIQALPAAGRPYQIFLGNPQSSKVTIGDADLQAATAAVQASGAQIFVHTPYIINLSAANDWNGPLLQKNAQYAVAAGFKGVVVHVGKSTTQPLQQALETMRAVLAAAIPFATPACPILLETPAGQGTETLRTPDEFIEFVRSFADPRLRICVDTCHVFACGHDPIAYLEKVLAHPDLLRLVHYNDSMEACGSCKDRHALAGTGHIGTKTMHAIASLCAVNAVPMVIE